MYFIILLYISTLTIKIGKCHGQVDLPEPKLVLLGQTGVGKSTIANTLLSCPLDSEDCPFQMCHGADLCTKKTSYGTGKAYHYCMFMNSLI